MSDTERERKNRWRDAVPRHRFDRPRGRIEEITIRSSALAGNLLGDPAERIVAVYLPEGYDGGEEEYPLFVDLVGYTGSGLKHVGWSLFGESVPQRLDRLVAEKKMGPVITLFPDCFTSLGGNQYINSVAVGRWADFLIDEVILAVESSFRVRRGREHRAVFGKSSGGYGAIVHGLLYADAWGAVACHSGDMNFDLVYRADFPKVVDALAVCDGSIEKFLARFDERPKVSGDDLHVLMILAMAATYDPDPNASKGIRLPVDPKTCVLDEERWARWLEHDPLRLVRRSDCVENLRSLRGLWIDCGSRDQYALHYGARAFADELTHAGIDHVYEEFDDDHSSVDYRMDRSLPYLYRAITR